MATTTATADQTASGVCDGLEWTASRYGTLVALQWGTGGDDQQYADEDIAAAEFDALVASLSE